MDSSSDDEPDSRFTSQLSHLRSTLVNDAPPPAETEEEEEVRQQQPSHKENVAAILAHAAAVPGKLLQSDAVESLVVIDTVPLVVEDVEDDKERELAFASSALRAVKTCRATLDDNNVPHIRPSDFMATMLKSDEHMSRIKRRLLVETKAMKVVEQRKNAKKYKARAKQIQQKKVEERSAKKRSNMELASKLRDRAAASDDLDFDKPQHANKRLKRSGGASFSGGKKTKPSRLGKSKRSGGAGRRGKGTRS